MQIRWFNGKLVCRWTAKFPERSTPKHPTQQDHPQKYADKVGLTGPVPGGLRWPGWESQYQNFVVFLLPTLPLAPQNPTPPATASHAPLTLQGCQAVLQGSLTKVSGSGVRWVGQGCRCKLYWETGKPRGSRPMNGALLKIILKQNPAPGGNQ
eukprot:1156532-Pelagomonas_calceolata.AAC.15